MGLPLSQGRRRCVDPQTPAGGEAQTHPARTTVVAALIDSRLPSRRVWRRTTARSCGSSYSTFGQGLFPARCLCPPAPAGIQRPATHHLPRHRPGCPGDLQKKSCPVADQVRPSLPGQTRPDLLPGTRPAWVSRARSPASGLASAHGCTRSGRPSTTTSIFCCRLPSDRRRLRADQPPCEHRRDERVPGTVLLGAARRRTR